MKEFHYSTKAKKDLKRYKNNPRKIKKLYEVLNLLVNDIEVPETFRPHKLIGQYKGCMECHIEEDFLLIWIDEESNIIDIIRLGTHSELF
ncbi:MAG: type II toxin-antitoxin system YafQ family toxin [Tannerellaceae bacterium]|jgi:mRNA interferase YafQ|nr:type II toxin-antitoxin system YafQ family toxin [Tannerellaceae bacterium]